VTTYLWYGLGAFSSMRMNRYKLNMRNKYRNNEETLKRKETQDYGKTKKI
jgi:hypothetical protein